MDTLKRSMEMLEQCDKIILEGLLMRNKVAVEIMEYKKAHGLQILQTGEEERQARCLERALKGSPYPEGIMEVFGCIRDQCKRIQARRLFDHNIVLIGFMGTGKSTIARRLGAMFAMEVVEMDQVIAQREGMSIPAIFETYGEQYFRDAETGLLIELQSRKDLVISCGGGTPMRERNVAVMKENGRVVLLDARPETIYERVKDDHSRPLIEKNKNIPFIAGLMEERRERYTAAADIIIQTDDKSILQICEGLIRRLAGLE